MSPSVQPTYLVAHLKVVLTQRVSAGTVVPMQDTFIASSRPNTQLALYSQLSAKHSASIIQPALSQTLS